MINPNPNFRHPPATACVTSPPHTTLFTKKIPPTHLEMLRRASHSSRSAFSHPGLWLLPPRIPAPLRRGGCPPPPPPPAPPPPRSSNMHSGGTGWPAPRRRCCCCCCPTAAPRPRTLAGAKQKAAAEGAAAAAGGCHASGVTVASGRRKDNWGPGPTAPAPARSPMVARSRLD
jgi:hypothetical protein